jgi:hypothetical protein
LVKYGAKLAFSGQNVSDLNSYSYFRSGIKARKLGARWK